MYDLTQDINALLEKVEHNESVIYETHRELEYIIDNYENMTDFRILEDLKIAMQRLETRN